MKIYIDLFFLFNIIMDLIIIMGVSIILERRTSYLRIILASLIGGISSLFLFTSFNKIILEIISIFIITVVSFGYRNIKYIFKNIIYMYILSTLLGGIIYMFNIRVSTNIFLSYLIIVIICIEVIFIYIKEMKKIKCIYNNYYKVNICFNNGKKIFLTGFLDTGNNLYDPYKRRPIILVSDKYISNDNYVLVPYHTLMGDSLLKCIKPKYIFIDGIGYKHDLLIGFTDNFKCLDGVDVILHKDLMKGWFYD